MDMKILDVTGGKLAKQGYETNGFGVEYFKDDLFSEAHNILQTILHNPPAYDYTWSVELVNDSDGSQYPDVYEAWTTAGGDKESLPTVAKLPELGKWGVGFGGKKNGERAAKLALAASIALDSELTPQIIYEFPDFGTLLSQTGVYEGGVSKGGGKSGGKSSGKRGRASPYGNTGYGSGGASWDGGIAQQLEEVLVGKMGGKGKGKGKLAAMLLGLKDGDVGLKGGGGKGWGGDGSDGWKGGGGKGWEGDGSDGWKGGGGKGWEGDGSDGWKGGGKWKGGSKGKKGGKGKEESKGPSLKHIPAENKVWVGKLPEGTTSETLTEHFAGYGSTVTGAVVMRNGTGCVAFESADEAATAIAVLNLSEMDGQAIEVDVWTKK